MLARPVVIVLAVAAALAGCVSAPDAGVEAASMEDAAGLAAAPETSSVEGEIMLSAAAPVRTINYGGEFSTLVEVTETTTGLVLELEWDAATPTSERLAMWVRAAGEGTIGVPPDPASLMPASAVAIADGPSPLRLALSADDFPEAGEYNVVVRASAQPAGIAATQPYTLHVTSFTGIPFDEAYTALE